jgi:ATP-dependent Clp protease adaptor protein ClpS
LAALAATGRRAKLRVDGGNGARQLRKAAPKKAASMSKTLVKPRTKVRTKTQRPPLYKVILLNDDYTPREFVVQVLKAVFRLNEDPAYRVMITAHVRGACVIAVFTRDVAETKAKEATELGKSKGYPLFFTTEPEQ